MSPKKIKKHPPRLLFAPFCCPGSHLLIESLIYAKKTQKKHTFDRLVKPTGVCFFSIKFVGECVFSQTYFSWVKKTHMYDHRYFLWFCETNRSVYFFRHTLARDQTTATSTVRGSFCSCCCCCCCCFIALPQSP